MRIDVITLFPEVFSAVTQSGITSRALKEGLWELFLWNPRDVTEDNHRTVDDRPYGGGPGMKRTLEKIRQAGNTGPVVAFSPTGRVFNEADVASMSAPASQYVFVCGRYEGIDERFLENYVDVTLSIGDFVISGGELAAMVVIDALTRRLPGAIRDESAQDESFRTGLLDAPHYTRPELWEGKPVPEVLLGGHHANIAAWTRRQALVRTARFRPDLLRAAAQAGLIDAKDREILRQEGFQTDF